MKSLTDFLSGTKKIISAGIVAATSTLSSLQSYAAPQVIRDTIEKIPMYDFNQKHVYDVALEVILSIDNETNLVSIEYMAENYNKENWTPQEMRIPLKYRYVPLSPPTMWVLHPDGVNVSKSDQVAHIVPQNKEIKLRPKEESRAYSLFEFGVKKLETGLDWFGENLAGIPIGSIMENFVKYERENRIADANVAAKNVRQNYQATEIDHHFADENYGFGFTETARGVQFSLDRADLTGDIPISILMRVQLGDPSDITGIFQTHLDFSLHDARKDSQVALERYFLQEDELKKAIPIKASDCMPNAETNPHFLKKTQLDEVKKAGLDLKNSGIGCYFLQPFNDNPKIPILEKPLVVVSVSEFRDEKDLKDKINVAGTGFASVDGKVVYVINNNCLGYDNLLRQVKRCDDDQIRNLNEIISLNLRRVQPKYILTNSEKISVDEFLKQLQ
ncbi:hypothetical protein HYT24_01695 [Candidatus Pacearchaeota archaeon]|nr:hypothetical protein [Candidatus Pacearchaeota archaeon]